MKSSNSKVVSLKDRSHCAKCSQVDRGKCLNYFGGIFRRDGRIKEERIER